MPIAARQLAWTEADYLAFEANSPVKHEFFAGEVFAMAGARPSHNSLVIEITVALRGRARSHGCTIFNSDQRIFIPSTGLYTYPDGGLVCGALEMQPDGMTLRNPFLLFEVLSPTTRAYDLGAKREQYQEIPSLRHIVIADEPDRHVWHYQRQAGQSWTLVEIGDGGSIELPNLGGPIPLAEIYPPASF